MEEEIKQSLHALSQENINQIKFNSTNRYNKSNSFIEISDWSNKHRHVNESLILPRIVESSSNMAEAPRRIVQSEISNYERKTSFGNIKPITIKFGLPEGLKGFQKSFYQNYIKQKSERKGSKVKPIDYFALQQHLNSYSLDKNINKTKSEHETARQSIINRVMNRKNRKKRQHFLQQFLIASPMAKSSQKKI